jgi:hypothetical protein
MKHLFLLTFLIILISCISDGKKVNSEEIILSNDTIAKINNLQKTEKNNPEKDYIKVRDNYLEYFKNIDFKKDTYAYKKDQKALSYLENRLRDILKGSHPNNSSDSGKINLESLTGDLGTGMLDGLKFEKDSFRFFYTTRTLFDIYFKTVLKNPIDKLTYRELEDIFNSTFYSDATVLNFSFLKMNSSNTNIAYGMFAMATQEIGPYLPDDLFVLKLDNNYVFMVEKRLNLQIVELPDCKHIWDSINLLAEKEFEKYKLSKLKDKLALKKNFELDKLALNEYCNCYQRNLSNEKQFEEIKKNLEQLLHVLN